MTVPQITARDLSPEEQQERAENCFALNERVKAGLRAGRDALWATADALYQFDEAAGHTALGYETLGEWLADPDISMTRSTYYRLVKAWRGLVINRHITSEDLKELDVSKVDIVLPSIESGKKSVQEALDDARELGVRDLREKYIGSPKEQTPPPIPAPEGEEKLEAEADAIIEGTARETDSGAEPVPAAEAGNPRTDFVQCAKDWDALYEELAIARGSGQEMPRIMAELIAPGLDGLAALLQEAGFDVDRIIGGEHER